MERRRLSGSLRNCLGSPGPLERCGRTHRNSLRFCSGVETKLFLRRLGTRLKQAKKGVQLLLWLSISCAKRVVSEKLGTRLNGEEEAQRKPSFSQSSATSTERPPCPCITSPIFQPKSFHFGSAKWFLFFLIISMHQIKVDERRSNAKSTFL